MSLSIFGAHPLLAEEHSPLVLHFESPRLTRLHQEVQVDPRDAMGRFWAELQGHGPLVEAIPGDAERLEVTFVWRADASAHYVGLLDGPPGDHPEKPLTRFADSDLWYLSARLPRDSRLSYAFATTDAPPDYLQTIGAQRGAHPDPLNPHTTFGRSHLDLPLAPPQPFAEAKPKVPAGARRDARLASAALHEDRGITVYTPPGYDPARLNPYPVVIALDGEWYGGWTEAPIQLPTTLDNLIAQGRIPPVVAVLVNNQGTRERDLALSEPFADFLSDELVPWLRHQYHVSSAAADTVLAGSSLGGLTSTYAAMRHPQVFGQVLSQSGAFFVSPGGWRPEVLYAQNPGWLMSEVVTRPRQPVRIWMEVGEFEPWPLLQSNRHLRDVLRAKGYAVTYREYHGGHDYAVWRGSIADGLIDLLGPVDPTHARNFPVPAP